MKKYYDLLIKIKHAQLNAALFIWCKKTNVCKLFLNILWENGFILGYCLYGFDYKIFLKYFNKKPSINFIRKLVKNHSKNLSVKQLWHLKLKNTILICSTSKGIKSAVECKKLNIGGEALFLVY
uniref:Ribosomal protein S8 n=1 Tax=Surirella sp. TaxID=1526603 RepID=A0A2R4A3K0_9STRA|nr:ribosomal protein S8 [Surirella sp.]